MEPWMIFSVICSVLLVWLFVRLIGSSLWNRFLLPAIDPGKNPSLAPRLATYIEAHFFSMATIKEKLLHPGNYQKLLPHVEEHVDHFLRVRLKEEMPVVGMMIGDRTIAQMKGIFLKELEVLFPEVMEGYVNNIKTEFDLSQLLTERLRSGGLEKIESELKPLINKAMIRLQLMGAGVGLIIGLVQVGLYFLLTA